MKTRICLVTIIFGALVFSGIVVAESATDELVAEMYTEREDLLKSVVEGWLNGEDPVVLGKMVYRLVDVQVRLQAIDKSAGLDSSARVISNAKVLRVDSKKKLAAAISLSFYRETGLIAKTRDIFDGKTYDVLPAGKVKQED